MRSWAVGVVLWVLAASGPALAQLPLGWEFATTSPDAYQGRLDRAIVYRGRGSGCLSSSEGLPSRQYAVLFQKLDARNYRGRRVRMTGHVRTERVAGWAGLWMRVDSPGGSPLEFDNMGNRPIQGTTGWQAYTLELSVPQEGHRICFGLLLAGSGEVRIDEVALGAVGPALPGARERSRVRSLPREPVNLDFER